MHHMPSAIIHNAFIHDHDPTVFWYLLQQVILDTPELSSSNICYAYVNLTNKFAHWLATSQDPDLFQFLTESVLHKLRSSEVYLIVDLGLEGWTDLDPNTCSWNLLYTNACKYGIPHDRIILITSNLLAEQSLQQFANQQGWTGCFRVFSFPLFEPHQRFNTRDPGLDYFIQQNVLQHTDRIFSSLSRFNRVDRTMAQFRLSESELAPHALISHDRIKSAGDWLRRHAPDLDAFSCLRFTRWTDTLPLVVDRSDFDVNWACCPGYEHIHHQTCFQIVNETFTSDYAGSSMFYSEKTFRPISCYQPFVIYGQPGINHYLQKLGYRLYDAWFDISWDYIPDPAQRHQAMLQALTPLVRWLLMMSPAQRCAWRFSHADILLHNVMVMQKSEYSVNKLTQFLKQLP